MGATPEMKPAAAAAQWPPRRSLPALLALALVPGRGAYVADKGLNLPPTQGTTKDGAFFPGVYSYEYDPQQVAWVVGGVGFSAVRLAVNLRSADDGATLRRHKQYIDALGGRGIVCFFEPASAPNVSWPRVGRVQSVGELAQMWRKVHAVFASYGENVMYELFNEPWGYGANAAEYYSDMMGVIDASGLPASRCILAGLYGSADVRSVAAAGWQGCLAYHTYSFYLPEGQRTREGFSKRILYDLWGLSSRVFITEFGTGLGGAISDVEQEVVDRQVLRFADRDAFTSDWLTERPTFAQTGANAGLRQSETKNFLSGLHDALLVLKSHEQGVRGAYHWHGWHNSDSWDFWDSDNAWSSRLIQQMMSDIAAPMRRENDTKAGSTMWDMLDEDYVNDDQKVQMLAVPGLVPAPVAPCPAACSGSQCLAGSTTQAGGKLLSSAGLCAHSCSRPFSGVRYCGAGSDYEGAGAVDCGACAQPARCGGLPCWSEHVSAHESGAEAAAVYLPVSGAAEARAGSEVGAAAKAAAVNLTVSGAAEVRASAEAVAAAKAAAVNLTVSGAAEARAGSEAGAAVKAAVVKLTMSSADSEVGAPADAASGGAHARKATAAEEAIAKSTVPSHSRKHRASAWGGSARARYLRVHKEAANAAARRAEIAAKARQARSRRRAGTAASRRFLAR